MTERVRVLVIGIGKMGRSHALAYQANDGFELVGLLSPSIHSRTDLAEFDHVAKFEDFEAALAAVRPDAVSINSYPDSHASYALAAMDAGCHVFMEKPMGLTVAEAETVAAKARETERKLVVGYILRVHPSWIKFVEIARTLGKPLVMRMNLNQQSSGSSWDVHKALMQSVSPIVDCGVHYVDVMCQMTGANPVRVHGIGAQLTDEVSIHNYGHLHVTFDDGSVGWYEAGWGPMMSEVAYFVKDVVGPKGCVSIVVPQEGQDDAKADEISTSASMDQHVKTSALKIHRSDLDEANHFAVADEWLSTEDEPDHQELCNREQAFFLKAIREDLDVTALTDDAIRSLKIVLAADESFRSGEVVKL